MCIFLRALIFQFYGVFCSSCVTEFDANPCRFWGNSFITSLETFHLIFVQRMHLHTIIFGCNSMYINMFLTDRSWCKANGSTSFPIELKVNSQNWQLTQYLKLATHFIWASALNIYFLDIFNFHHKRTTAFIQIDLLPFPRPTNIKCYWWSIRRTMEDV